MHPCISQPRALQERVKKYRGRGACQVASLRAHKKYIGAVGERCVYRAGSCHVYQSATSRARSSAAAGIASRGVAQPPWQATCARAHTHTHTHAHTHAHAHALGSSVSDSVVVALPRRTSSATSSPTAQRSSALNRSDAFLVRVVISLVMWVGRGARASAAVERLAQAGRVPGAAVVAQIISRRNQPKCRPRESFHARRTHTATARALDLLVLELCDDVSEHQAPKLVALGPQHARARGRAARARVQHEDA